MYNFDYSVKAYTDRSCISSEKSNFALLCGLKTSLRRGWVVQKSLQTPLRNMYKDDPLLLNSRKRLLI